MPRISETEAMAPGDLIAALPNTNVQYERELQEYGKQQKYKKTVAPAICSVSSLGLFPLLWFSVIIMRSSAHWWAFLSICTEGAVPEFEVYNGVRRVKGGGEGSGLIQLKNFLSAGSLPAQAGILYDFALEVGESTMRTRAENARAFARSKCYTDVIKFIVELNIKHGYTGPYASEERWMQLLPDTEGTENDPMFANMLGGNPPGGGGGGQPPAGGHGLQAQFGQLLQNFAGNQQGNDAGGGVMQQLANQIFGGGQVQGGAGQLVPMPNANAPAPRGPHDLEPGGEPQRKRSRSDDFQAAFGNLNMDPSSSSSSGAVLVNNNMVNGPLLNQQLVPPGVDPQQQCLIGAQQQVVIPNIQVPVQPPQQGVVPIPGGAVPPPQPQLDPGALAIQQAAVQPAQPVLAQPVPPPAQNVNIGAANPAVPVVNNVAGGGAPPPGAPPNNNIVAVPAAPLVVQPDGQPAVQQIPPALPQQVVAGVPSPQQAIVGQQMVAVDPSQQAVAVAGVPPPQAVVVPGAPPQQPAVVVVDPPAQQPAVVVADPPAQQPAVVVQQPAVVVVDPPAQQPAVVGAGPPAQQPAVVVADPPAQQPAVVVADPPAQQPAVVVADPPAQQPAVVVADPPAQQPAVVVADPPQQGAVVVDPLQAAAQQAAAQPGLDPSASQVHDPAAGANGAVGNGNAGSVVGAVPPQQPSNTQVVVAGTPSVPPQSGTPSGSQQSQPPLAVAPPQTPGGPLGAPQLPPAAPGADPSSAAQLGASTPASVVVHQHPAPAPAVPPTPGTPLAPQQLQMPPDDGSQFVGGPPAA